MLERTIEKEQREAAGLEKKIKRAQDNWKPALEKLVSSIGKKFSATFDRESSCLRFRSGVAQPSI